MWVGWSTLTFFKKKFVWKRVRKTKLVAKFLTIKGFIIFDGVFVSNYLRIISYSCFFVVFSRQNDSIRVWYAVCCCRFPPSLCSVTTTIVSNCRRATLHSIYLFDDLLVAPSIYTQHGYNGSLSFLFFFSRTQLCRYILPAAMYKKKRAIDTHTSWTADEPYCVSAEIVDQKKREREKKKRK